MAAIGQQQQQQQQEQQQQQQQNEHQLEREKERGGEPTREHKPRKDQRRKANSYTIGGLDSVGSVGVWVVWFYFCLMFPPSMAPCPMPAHDSSGGRFSIYSFVTPQPILDMRWIHARRLSYTLHDLDPILGLEAAVVCEGNPASPFYSGDRLDL